MTVTSDHHSWGIGSSANTNFERAVRALNPKAKQAMYAAANRGLIRRKTWNGCAFNQAGNEVQMESGQPIEAHLVHSEATAMGVFDLPAIVVRNFIVAWDNLPGSDVECTELLKSTILKAGLFSEANESSARQRLRETVYKAYETKMKEDFETLVEGLDLDENNALVTDMKEASELLCSSSC